MTTGLQRTFTTVRPGRITALARFVATFRAPRRPVRLHRARASGVSTVRPAHEIRRGQRAHAPTRARDVHDAAVMRGVFPPRV